MDRFFALKNTEKNPLIKNEQKKTDGDKTVKLIIGNMRDPQGHPLPTLMKK